MLPWLSYDDGPEEFVGSTFDAVGFREDSERYRVRKDNDVLRKDCLQRQALNLVKGLLSQGSVVIDQLDGSDGCSCLEEEQFLLDVVLHAVYNSLEGDYDAITLYRLLDVFCSMSAQLFLHHESALSVLVVGVMYLCCKDLHKCAIEDASKIYDDSREDEITDLLAQARRRGELDLPYLLEHYGMVVCSKLSPTARDIYMVWDRASFHEWNAIDAIDGICEASQYPMCVKVEVIRFIMLRGVLYSLRTSSVSLRCLPSSLVALLLLIIDAGLDCETKSCSRHCLYASSDEAFLCVRSSSNVVELQNLLCQLVPSLDHVAAKLKVAERIICLVESVFQSPVYPFGSFGNGLWLCDSDIDLLIALPHASESGRVGSRAAVRELARHICQCPDLSVTSVTRAAVPVLKIMYEYPGLKPFNYDVTFGNLIASRNTRLLREYTSIDVRVRLLGFFVKRWTWVRGINRASSGYLSSYAWTLMLIYFLQTRTPPILPNLQEGPCASLYLGEVESKGSSDGVSATEFSVCSKLVVETCSLPHKGLYDLESVSELLALFFRFYAYQFNFAHDIVCVRYAPRCISKKDLFTGLHQDEFGPQPPDKPKIARTEGNGDVGCSSSNKVQCGNGAYARMLDDAHIERLPLLMIDDPLEKGRVLSASANGCLVIRDELRRAADMLEQNCPFTAVCASKSVD